MNMVSVEEAAEKFASVFVRSEQHFAEECYIAGATEQHKIDIQKACEVYRKELLEITSVFNKVGKEFYNANGLGEIISVEGSVADFRKAIEE